MVLWRHFKSNAIYLFVLANRMFARLSADCFGGLVWQAPQKFKNVAQKAAVCAQPNALPFPCEPGTFPILNNFTPLEHEHFAAHRELETLLKASLRGDVLFDLGSRALYAADSSNYRQLPIGVIYPRDPADVEAALAACRHNGRSRPSPRRGNQPRRPMRQCGCRFRFLPLHARARQH